MDARRAVVADEACRGFPAPGEAEADDADDFRWAVSRMVEHGLLEVVG